MKNNFHFFPLIFILNRRRSQRKGKLFQKLKEIFLCALSFLSTFNLMAHKRLKESHCPWNIILIPYAQGFEETKRRMDSCDNKISFP